MNCSAGAGFEVGAAVAAGLLAPGPKRVTVGRLLRLGCNRLVVRVVESDEAAVALIAPYIQLIQATVSLYTPKVALLLYLYKIYNIYRKLNLAMRGEFIFWVWASGSWRN